jgi:hypothetical protein
MTGPSRDEFEAWKADAVTQFVMAGVAAIADAQAGAWFEVAWNRGDLSDVTRERMRTRAESFMELANLTIEDAYGANGLTAPKPAESA